MTTVLDRFRLDGRRALVTGGASGLGRVIASALAEAGAEVAIASRTRDACETAALEIQAETGRRACAFSADVTSASDVDRLISEVGGTIGEIDILVNNAGINIRGSIEELSEADFDAVIAHEHKISPSLDGRSVFDDQRKRTFYNPRQRSLF